MVQLNQLRNNMLNLDYKVSFNDNVTKPDYEASVYNNLTESI